MTALQKLDAAWAAGRRICVGLDSRHTHLPPMFQAHKDPYLGMKAFNTHIIKETADLALAYKFNMAPYLRHGRRGIAALEESCELATQYAPGALIIIDQKPGDALDDINADYAHFAFSVCGADALTANPYTGQDAAGGFTRYEDKLIFFLCKTSNQGSSEFQDIEIKRGGVQFAHKDDPVLLYHDIAMSIMMHWNKYGNCGLVVGATYPEQMKKVRDLAGDMPILAPGIGKQAGEFEKTIRNGVVSELGRLIINEGRSIIFASNDDDDFAEAARHRLEQRTKEYGDILASITA